MTMKGINIDLRSSRIHGCDVGRGFVIGYVQDTGWYVYIDDPNLLRKVKRGKVKAIHKHKTIRVSVGNKVYERSQVVRVSVKDKKIVEDLSEVVKPGDIVIMERTGANGLRYANILKRIGAKVYIVDGKQFSRFRNGFNPSKDDYTDASMLATYGQLYIIQRDPHLSKYIQDLVPFLSSTLLKFLKEIGPLRLYIIHKVELKLRHLINEYRRADADLTEAINRLKDHLTAFLPSSDAFRTRKYILNHINEFPSMIEDADYKEAVEYEIERVKISLKRKQMIERRIEQIAMAYYPKEWKILSTLPHISTVQKAVILAYGGIRVVEGKMKRDEFIGYAIEGTNRKQSGRVDTTSTDKMRREVLHLFWIYYTQAHLSKSPLRPLVEYLKTVSYGGDIFEKRYRKFLDKLFEIVRIMLKYRLSFHQALHYRYKQLSRHLTRLYNLGKDVKRKQMVEMGYISASIKTILQMLDIEAEPHIQRILDEITTEV